jgi:hypothetical protein
MANIDITPNGGQVTLRGIPVPLDHAIAGEFIRDAVRFIESVLTEQELRKKYQLDDAAWRQLETNEPLQQRVAAEKTRRIVSGETAREKAAHLYALTAVDIVGDIVKDHTASAKASFGRGA